MLLPARNGSRPAGIPMSWLHLAGGSVRFDLSLGLSVLSGYASWVDRTLAGPGQARLPRTASQVRTALSQRPGLRRAPRYEPHVRGDRAKASFETALSWLPSRRAQARPHLPSWPALSRKLGQVVLL